MLDILLYTTLTCAQTNAVILRMRKYEHLDSESKIELIEVMKESNPKCEWDAND